MEHTLKPDAQGHINIDGKSGVYKPGDTIYVVGNPKDVLLSNIIGAVGQRISITNAPGEKLTIGNPAWNGGGYSYALMFKGCKYINLFGSDKDSFVISGSTTTQVDRGAYFNLRIDELSDNFSVHDLSVRNGGNAIWCKTEVSKTNPKTWSPNVLENFEFYNIDIRNTYTEGLYIGHTAPWWNTITYLPYYSGVPTDLNTYKQPVKLKNVVIRNCYLEGCGLDGIQASAIDGLQVYDNEVVNWGVNKNSSHSGGILIGGRVVGFNMHDNYVHDGWGDMVQIYAEGGAACVIKNNLLVNNAASIGSGISMMGTDNLIAEVVNNTIIKTGGSCIRVNGAKGQKGKQIIHSNILVEPKWFAGIAQRNYIYEENGGTFTDTNNKKFQLLADAKLDTSNNYQPIIGSPAAGAGYIEPVVEPPPTPTLVVSISLPTLTLKEGANDLKLTMPDGTTSNIKITVEREK